MKALILAAGLGSRLKERTSDKPKALTEVGGKEILQYQLEALVANNIKDIVIVVGYKSEKIKEFIAKLKEKDEFRELNVSFVENERPQETSSGYSLWVARDYIKDEQYIHLNCDIVFFKDIIKKLIEFPHDNVIVVNREVALNEPMEQVEVEGEKIIKMEKIPFPEAQAKAHGLAKFSPENIKWVIDKVKENLDKGEMKKSCFGIIRQAVHHKDFFALDKKDCIIFEINTVEQLMGGEEILRKNLNQA